MTYLFVVVCLSVVHAMADSLGVDELGHTIGTPLAELIAIDAITIACIIAFEKTLKVDPTKLIQYDRIELIKRERWQYTYRPEQTVDRWDFDNACWQDKVRYGKGKNQLRSRLQIEYDKKRALVTPYANVELYNSWAVEKIRYTVGADFDLAKQHRLGIFYRFQDMRQVDADDYDPDMHYIGLGYKFKF